MAETLGTSPASETQAGNLIERGKHGFTSPTELALLRHEASVFGLTSPLPPGVSESLFCPDEMAVCRNIGIPLPTVWQPGETAQNFLPSYFRLERAFDEALGSGKTIGLIFMVADMFNAGHLHSLYEAKTSRKCDFLVLMLTSNFLTANMKSAEDNPRPKMSLGQRVFMASQFVDAVYAMPAVYERRSGLFELMSQAKAAEQIAPGVEPKTDEIRKIYGTAGFKSYLSRHTGVPLGHIPRLKKRRSPLKPSIYFTSDVYPAPAQVPYCCFWDKWKNHFKSFVIFASEYNPKESITRIRQAQQFLPEGRNLRVHWIKSGTPETSSSKIYNKHPMIVSEALQESLSLLDELLTWPELKEYDRYFLLALKASGFRSWYMADNSFLYSQL